MPHNWQGLYDLQMILILYLLLRSRSAGQSIEAIQNIDSCMNTNTELTMFVIKFRNQ